MSKRADPGGRLHRTLQAIVAEVHPQSGTLVLHSVMTHYPSTLKEIG